MGNWEVKRLDEIASKVTDGSHNPPKKVESGFPMYSGRNLIDGKLDFSNPSRYVDTIGFEKENKRTSIQSGDIFLSIVGSIGLTAVVPEKFDPFVIQRSIALIRTDQNSEFIRYYFESPYFQDYLENESKGAAQKGVYLTTLRETKIPLPPLPEQQRIVFKLDGLFEKIDKAISLLEENIEHTQALMGSVLDEEFGKLEKFNKSLMSFCKNAKKDMVGGPFGSNLKASEYVDQGYPIIRLQNVDRFNFKEKNIKFVTEEKAEFLSSHSYVSGDIVMTKLGDPLGKCCIVEDVLGINRGVISSDIIRIRIDESKHYKPYVVAGINSEYFIKQLKSKTQGSTRPRVTLKEVRAMQLPMLERKDQLIAAERIDDILGIQLDILEAQTQKVDHLKALKSSLLDQAFKGEL